MENWWRPLADIPAKPVPDNIEVLPATWTTLNCGYGRWPPVFRNRMRPMDESKLPPGCSTPFIVSDLLMARDRSWHDETVKWRVEACSTLTEIRPICARPVADFCIVEMGYKLLC